MVSFDKIRLRSVQHLKLEIDTHSMYDHELNIDEL